MDSLELGQKFIVTVTHWVKFNVMTILQNRWIWRVKHDLKILAVSDFELVAEDNEFAILADIDVDLLFYWS